MHTPIPCSGRDTLPYRRLTRASLLLASIALAGVAMAAPCASSDCRVAKQDPQLPMRDLTVRIVDLAEAAAAADAAAAARLSESMAPLLYLAPRVTSILEEVFADSGAATPAENAASELAEASSPVADVEADPEQYAPLAPAGNAAHLPKFQRQMFRTDI